MVTISVLSIDYQKAQMKMECMLSLYLSTKKIVLGQKVTDW